MELCSLQHLVVVAIEKGAFGSLSTNGRQLYIFTCHQNVILVITS